MRAAHPHEKCKHLVKCACTLVPVMHSNVCARDLHARTHARTPETAAWDIDRCRAVNKSRAGTRTRMQFTRNDRSQHSLEYVRPSRQCLSWLLPNGLACAVCLEDDDRCRSTSCSTSAHRAASATRLATMTSPMLLRLIYAPAVEIWLKWLDK